MMKTMFKFSLFCMTLSIGFTQNAFSVNYYDSIPKGQIVDSIFCKANPKYSYALYLPKLYDENKTWPVIFIFDPGANGKSKAILFKEAAEQYGYILVCSNNSKNGPGDENVKAINYMMDDAFSRFSFDDKRIYTSGFSGGSRVASFIALNTHKVAGVIGCGAGFPGMESYQVSDIRDFIYVGLIGKRDMNYPEMLELEKTLEKSNINERLIVSELKHQPPSKESILNAVEWLELYAMKKSSIKTNEEFVGKQYRKYTDTISNLQKRDDIIETASNIKYLLNDFKGLVNIEMYKTKHDSIVNSELYKKKKNEEDEVLKSEKNKVNDYYKLALSIRESGEFTDSIYSYWISEININERLQKKGTHYKEYMASHLLTNIYFIQSELGEYFYSKKNYPYSVKCYKLCCLSMPEYKFVLYKLACAQALSKNKKTAYKTIKKLIELGFKDKKALESEPSFIDLKNTNRFKELLDRME
jgi:hypothetical protein